MFLEKLVWVNHMIRRINSFIQNYFIKKRIVYTLKHTIEYKGNADYNIIEIDDRIFKRYKNFLQQYIDEIKLKERVSNPYCTGFLAIHRKTDRAVGFEWTIVSHKKEYRHDNFLVPKNEGLLFNAYVTEEHRGKGVFRKLKTTAANYLLNVRRCNNAFSVVESLNKSSINANQQIGSIEVGRNYLIKVLKRNVFSITILDGKKISFEYVLTGSKKIKI